MILHLKEVSKVLISLLYISNVSVASDFYGYNVAHEKFQSSKRTNNRDLQYLRRKTKENNKFKLRSSTIRNYIQFQPTETLNSSPNYIDQRKRILKKNYEVTEKLRHQSSMKLNQIRFIKGVKTKLNMSLEDTWYGYPTSKFKSVKKVSQGLHYLQYLILKNSDSLWLIWDMFFVFLILPIGIIFSVDVDSYHIIGRYHSRPLIYFVVVALEIAFNFFRGSNTSSSLSSSKAQTRNRQGSGNGVRERVKTAIEYIKLYFWLDVLMIIPVETFKINLNNIIWCIPFLPYRQYIRLTLSIRRILQKVC